MKTNNGRFMMIKCHFEEVMPIMLLFQDNVYDFTYLHPCSEISLLDIKRVI